MKINNRKRKKGFTLIEMVAVVAIIGILAAVLVPKITGYLNEAKKTEVIDEARKVAQAYEAAKMKGTDKLKDGTKLAKTTTLSAALNTTTGNTTMISLIEGDNLDKLGGPSFTGVTIGHCVDITEGSDFTINSSSAVLNPSSVTTK
ncbi:MAG: type IV pilin protein [Clostridium sp.]